jgi:hypothetical protein
MTEKKKKRRGRKPEVFRVPLPFEEAVRAGLETSPPTAAEKNPRRLKPKKS